MRISPESNARALALVALLSTWLGCERRAFLFQIPPGYVGWVEVEYGKPDCPPASQDGTWLVLPVAHDGRGCVRDAPAGTWVRKRYVSRDASHTALTPGRDIWREGHAVENNQGTVSSRAFVFFVGREVDIKTGGLPHRP
jgi:hypothetical protein